MGIKSEQIDIFSFCKRLIWLEMKIYVRKMPKVCSPTKLYVSGPENSDQEPTLPRFYRYKCPFYTHPSTAILTVGIAVQDSFVINQCAKMAALNLQMSDISIL